MKERIRNICEELCCKDLFLDEELIETGLLDSFKLMELICSLEAEFQVVFQPEEISNLDNFSCVNSINAVINNKIISD